MASPELSPLPAAMASCTRPTVRPASQMARVVDSVEGVRNVHVVYSESYHAAVFDKPRSLRDASEFCAQIGGRDNRAFRFCDRNALAWQEDARRMRLLVVAQGCAFFDRGKRWKGGTYDGRQYIVAAHAGAVPAFHGRNVREYERLACGLAPYSHEAQSHFWTGTAPYVLTLYDVLPASVPIVVAWSPALERMFAMLDVDPRRLVRFDTAATYYAKVLYSVVPSPYGAHGALGGEPSGAPAFARVQKHMRGAARLPASSRTAIVVLNRADRKSRRCSTHAQMMGKLRARFGGSREVVDLVGTKRTQQENAALFGRARVIVGPHGGGFMNLMYAAAGTDVVEIGYYGQEKQRAAMQFPSVYMTLAAHLSQRYWLVMGRGSYNGPIDCPVDAVVETVARALDGGGDRAAPSAAPRAARSQGAAPASPVQRTAGNGRKILRLQDIKYAK